MSHSNSPAPKYKPASRGPDFSKPGGRTPEQPWLSSWGELLLVIFLGIPFILLSGLYVAGLALLIRKWFRVPYLLSMIVLYVLLLLPMWWLVPEGSAFPVVALGLVFFSLSPIALAGRHEMFEGDHLDEAVPAHIILILMYFLLPALNAANAAAAKAQFLSQI